MLLNFISLLKLVTVMENWLPLPTPPFGESALSSVLVHLQWRVLYSSASQVEAASTTFLETMAGMLRDQVTQMTQHQSDVTEFLDLIESHRPLKDYEMDVRDTASIVAQCSQETDRIATEIEQMLARIKDRRSAKEDNATNNSGATNISDAIGGTDPFALMLL